MWGSFPEWYCIVEMLMSHAFQLPFALGWSFAAWLFAFLNSYNNVDHKGKHCNHPDLQSPHHC